MVNGMFALFDASQQTYHSIGLIIIMLHMPIPWLFMQFRIFRARCCTWCKPFSLLLTLQVSFVCVFLQTCGDSQCEQTYSFIGRGTGRGTRGQKITYAEAWEGFRRSMTSGRIPCTAVSRYPVQCTYRMPIYPIWGSLFLSLTLMQVVARWRADVDYTAAGLFMSDAWLYWVCVYICLIYSYSIIIFWHFC